MKTTEELNALQEEIKALRKRLAELSEEELTQVTGGRFKEDDIERISFLHDLLLKKYPNRSVQIDLLFSLIEKEPQKFSYLEVFQMVTPVIIS